MVDKIIPPRRNETLTQGGIGLLRFMEYIERSASQVNESTEANEADPSSINLSSSQISQFNKSIAELVNQSIFSQSSVITKLNKRIEQLESTITSNQNNNKKLTQLENDFTALL